MSDQLKGLSELDGTHQELKLYKNIVIVGIKLNFQQLRVAKRKILSNLEGNVHIEKLQLCIVDFGKNKYTVTYFSFQLTNQNQNEVSQFIQEQKRSVKSIKERMNQSNKHLHPNITPLRIYLFFFPFKTSFQLQTPFSRKENILSHFPSFFTFHCCCLHPLFAINEKQSSLLEKRKQQACRHSLLLHWI